MEWNGVAALRDSASDSDSKPKLVIRSGRSSSEALLILVPEDYKNQPTLMVKYPEVVDFYKGQMEAWDGPALILFRLIPQMMHNNSFQMWTDQMQETKLVPAYNMF